MSAQSPVASGSSRLNPSGEMFDSQFACWVKHLLALYFPILACVFLLTAPHPWYLAILFIGFVIYAEKMDTNGKSELRAPNPDFADWPYDLIMFIAAGFQFLNIYLYVNMFATQDFFRLDSLLALLFVGVSSGYSGITLAHEFIHRRSKFFQWVGRALLVTVYYEHFYTEHLRGHHVKVATDGDPASAKFNENFWPFYFKTVPAQFKSAWNIELKRLDAEGASLGDLVATQKIWSHRVAQGVMAQVALALVIFLLFGWVAFIMMALQAVFASRLLEIVNYFEHWGLERNQDRVQPCDSWDTHSWFTYYGLVGLTRHADHHANPTRPYQHLRTFDESPILPRGYIGMVYLVMAKQQQFKEEMTEALKTAKLGPFREEATSET